MASLTPQSRSNEVTGDAMNEGLINGAIVFVPSLGGLYAAMRNPTFRKVRILKHRKRFYNVFVHSPNIFT